jgi:hypothetical protein
VLGERTKTRDSHSSSNHGRARRGHEEPTDERLARSAPAAADSCVRAGRSPDPGAAGSVSTTSRSTSSTIAGTEIPITHDRIPTKERSAALRSAWQSARRRTETRERWLVAEALARREVA